LYADDVAFRAFIQLGALRADEIFEFFLDWISDKPVRSRSAKTVWLNVELMLNNCFAVSNMIRHGTPDIGNQAENKIQRFLSQTNERMKEAFTYFKGFMTNLEENITEKEFEQSLTKYLIRVVALAN
jgi:hypothetical protein